MEEAEPVGLRVSRVVRADTTTTGARFSDLQPTIESPPVWCA